MAYRIIANDLPKVPRVFTPISVAQTPEENDRALFYAFLARAGVYSSVESMPDDLLIELTTEPEFYADCSGFEQELIVRLSARPVVGLDDLRFD